MIKTLLAELTEYGAGDVYPYHMPGHKRKTVGNMSEDISRIDITEIDGFDNMHYPEGILLEAQQRAAALYGSECTFFLVNGSTVGNLAAISGTVQRGGKILIARNCHKSVYHGAYLREAELCYITPPMNEQFGFCEPVTAVQVREALESETDVEAVLVVSPTYEGRIADIGAIASVVHSYGIPLIVDEAHGAHLGLNSHFAKNSIQAGADVVIHSLHKTLPSLTQTALLHVQGSLVSAQQIQKYLRIYQSSSPSYVFMASMDECICEMMEHGNERLEKFYQNWVSMMNVIQNCKMLHFPMDASQDIGKLVISVKNTKMTGVMLYERLLRKYRLQMEMACDTYVLAMFTVGDTKEGFLRMQQALLEIDAELERQEVSMKNIGAVVSEEFIKDANCERQETALENTEVCMAERITKATSDSEIAYIPFWKAYDLPKREIPLEKAEGYFSGEFVSVYPPGVPILIPGEKITREYMDNIYHNLKQGLTVQGIRKKEDRYWIAVV